MKRTQTAGVFLVVLSIGYLYLSLFHGIGSNLPWLLWIMGTLGGFGLFLLKNKI